MGMAISFGVSTAVWLLALAVLLTLRGPFRPARAAEPRTIRADIREGLSFLVHRPVLRTMALMVGMTNLATSAVGVVFVLFAVGPESAMRLSESQFGLLFALLAGGGLLGGLVGDRVQRPIGRARALTFSVFGMIGFVGGPGSRRTWRSSQRCCVRRRDHEHAVEHHHRVVSPAGHA